MAETHKMSKTPEKKLRVAIVGSGISGNATAYYLRKTHEVTVFEAEPKRAGGHACTYEVGEGEHVAAADLGFQVFNLSTYPYLQVARAPSSTRQ